MTSRTLADDKFGTYLPLVKLVLFRLVGLDKVIEHLFQAFCIGLEGWPDVFHGPFHEHAVNHPEAGTVPRQWCQGFENKSGQGGVIVRGWAVRQNVEFTMLAVKPI